MDYLNTLNTSKGRTLMNLSQFINVVNGLFGTLTALLFSYYGILTLKTLSVTLHMAMPRSTHCRLLLFWICMAYQTLHPLSQTNGTGLRYLVFIFSRRCIFVCKIHNQIRNLLRIILKIHVLFFILRRKYSQ